LQYLKSIRLERNRKTGFKCPRGCGKGSAHKEPCPGKIDKSHPIHPRNEEQKKKKKVPGLSSCMQYSPDRAAVEDWGFSYAVKATVMARPCACMLLA
jgi:hypothetical protein